MKNVLESLQSQSNEGIDGIFLKGGGGRSEGRARKKGKTYIVGERESGKGRERKG